ncbi:uncharacterized protein DNG_02933 [Cephalotrichum gorgonifer]|uniref:N-acetyltransferase domain-containing protein n=1 Tax=Cephalotrichum gorgonifer TaxID=2041049 RepID=A0AAE8MVN9_9PEZI|nr:uncharacterized protein DNG_02933 [Cephalotrichum gorgonifer]
MTPPRIPDYEIRAAREGDLPAIMEIGNHYILNTVLTFALEPRKLADFTSTYDSIASKGFPYIVAASTGSSSPPTILGYASASQFRATLGAYEHTAEISLYCHPSYKGGGVGTRLLGNLLGALRNPSAHAGCFPGAERGVEPRVVKQVLAVMAVDELAEGNGLGLRDYYVRNGFEPSGHLKRVGFKFGRWIDTMYLQLTL